MLVLSSDSKPTSTRLIRSAADDIILARDTFPSSLFNPYIVRARAKGNHEQPYILVAVAQGVKTA